MQRRSLCKVLRRLEGRSCRALARLSSEHRGAHHDPMGRLVVRPTARASTGHVEEPSWPMGLTDRNGERRVRTHRVTHSRRPTAEPQSAVASQRRRRLSAQSGPGVVWARACRHAQRVVVKSVIACPHTHTAQCTYDRSDSPGRARVQHEFLRALSEASPTAHWQCSVSV